MPVYEYTALDIKGKNVSGIVDADSATSARQKLRVSKVYPVTINKVSDHASGKEVKPATFQSLFTRVRPVDISIMTRQLATLIGAGFPLVSALDSLVPQTRSHAFKKVLAHIKDSIIAGNNFSDALSIYPNLFPPLYTNMVRAGESSGTLEIILERLAEISEKQMALNSRIKTVMIYPAIMATVGAIVLFFLLAVIVPDITSIFSEMDQVLPAPTRVLISISTLFQSFWWVVLIAVAVIMILFRMINKTTSGRFFMDRMTLVLPWVGTLTKKLATARFSRTLGSLLENGVSMLPALDIVKNIVGNTQIARTVESAAQEVEKGQGLGNSLSESNAFPYLSVQMIQLGENSGELEKMLNKIADVYENDVESSVLRMTTVLEPAMIILMGIIVGFIVFSICLPIFEMNQLIK